MCYNNFNKQNHQTEMERSLMFPLFAASLNNEDNRSKVEKIWGLYRGLMIYEARRILNDSALAEDAVQESFIKLIRYLEKIDDITSHETKAYIVSIVRSICIDMLRKAGSGKDNLNLDDVVEIIPDDNPDILSKIALSESFNVVKEAIQALPPDQRIVIHLFLIEEHSHAEIAEILGITESASRARLKRAKNAIRKKLGGEINVK